MNHERKKKEKNYQYNYKSYSEVPWEFEIIKLKRCSVATHQVITYLQSEILELFPNKSYRYTIHKSQEFPKECRPGLAII